MEQDSQKREAEETEFHAASMPTLCANNCGFFGSSATNNLCSKCYRDVFLSKSKALAMEAVAAAVVGPEKDSVVVDGQKNKQLCGGDVGEVKGEDDLGVVGGPSGELSAPKKPANRCNFCNKRVGLMGFKCRCGEVFCTQHRYSDKHNCVFDYRGAGQDAIARANPIVKADKVEKI